MFQMKSVLFPYKKSFINQGCSVKIAEYWPFCVFMDLDPVLVHKHAKKKLANDSYILMPVRSGLRLTVDHSECKNGTEKELRGLIIATYVLY